MIQRAWLDEHPGRTRAEYNRLLKDNASEVWEWRRAKGRAINDAERQAWEHDHSGETFPEHDCGLSEREVYRLRTMATATEEAPAAASG